MLVWILKKGISIHFPPTRKCMHVKGQHSVVTSESLVSREFSGICQSFTSNSELMAISVSLFDKRGKLCMWIHGQEVKFTFVWIYILRSNMVKILIQKCFRSFTIWPFCILKQRVKAIFSLKTSQQMRKKTSKSKFSVIDVFKPTFADFYQPCGHRGSGCV